MQVDTAPGNGAASWVWVYSASWTNGGAAMVRYVDGSSDWFQTDYGTAQSWNTSKKIASFTACSYIWPGSGNQFRWECNPTFVNVG